MRESVSTTAGDSKYGRSLFAVENISREQLSMFDQRDMALYASGMFTWKADLEEGTISRTNLSGGLGDTWTLARFLSFVHDNDKDPVNALFLDGARNKEIDIDIRIGRNGEYCWYKVKGAVYQTPGQDKTYGIGVAYDIDRIKEHTQRLEYLEKHDYLTGLINMDAFDTQFVHIAKYSTYPQALVIANIDHLKEINDTLGYRAGNTLIKNVAHVLDECFYDADLIARIGGGEYCAVFSGIDKAEVAMKIKEAGMMLHRMYMNLIKTEVTFGYAVTSEPLEFLILYRKAMDAMQKKKAMKQFLNQQTVVDEITRIISKKAGWGRRQTRLRSLSIQIAHKLGLSESRINEIKILAKIADIGFIALDDALVRQRLKLSGKDRMRFLRHIEYGRALLSSIDGLHEIEPLYLDIYKRYDEWMDGISISSRIIAGAAAFDDIVSGAEEVTFEKISTALGKQKGVTLCPVVVDEICDVVKTHYAHCAQK